MLWIPCIGRIFCGEPASTSPENALAAHIVKVPIVFANASHALR
jgi:hypothetical protein